MGRLAAAVKRRGGRNPGRGRPLSLPGRAVR
jgi:hypothetical protein